MSEGSEEGAGLDRRLSGIHRFYGKEFDYWIADLYFPWEELLPALQGYSPAGEYDIDKIGLSRRKL